MPIRRVKTYSDRGSIKDLVNVNTDVSSMDPPSPSELRLQKLYEYAQTFKDTKMQSALGIITTDYIADKNALPLSAYRIRKIIDEIKSKSGDQIDALALQLGGYMRDEIGPEAIAYLERKRLTAQVKTASVRKPPVFWRARKS